MKKIIFLLAVMAVIFASCEKEDLEKKNFYISQNSFNTDYFVRDGYLVFKNKTSFIKTVNQIINLNDGVRKKWEETIGFQSQRSLINKLIEQELILDSINRIRFKIANISKATKYDLHPELYYNLLSKGIIKLINKGTPDEYWDLSVCNKLYAEFINKDGLYAIGDTLFQANNTGIKNIIIEEVNNYEENLKKINSIDRNFIELKKAAESSPGLLLSPWTANNNWPGVSRRIQIGIELTCLNFYPSTAQFDFTHNYYVYCQKTNFWNNWIYEYPNYTVEGQWTIYVYRYSQNYSSSFNYNGTAQYGIINPQTGIREYAGTIFSVLPNEANQSYPYVFQQAYEPEFNFYRWIAKRNDTGQEAIIKSYAGPY